jgi:hypothetical protein
VETERPDAEMSERGRQDRDDDLVALEGLEAEFSDLEAELMRVEQSRGEGPAERGT